MGLVERAGWATLLLAAGLGGCGTSTPLEESAYQGVTGPTRTPGPLSSRPVVDEDGRCRDYGFLPGTVDYARCVAELRKVRTKARTAASERAGDR
jgi:hypothetical protein